MSAFELQGLSGKDPSLAGTDLASSDLRYAGVQYDAANGVFVFAVATWESWATPAEVAFSIVVDGNDDGTDDKVLMNIRSGTTTSSSGRRATTWPEPPSPPTTT